MIVLFFSNLCGFSFSSLALARTSNTMLNKSGVNHRALDNFSLAQLLYLWDKCWIYPFLENVSQIFYFSFLKICLRDSKVPIISEDFCFYFSGYPLVNRNVFLLFFFLPSPPFPHSSSPSFFSPFFPPPSSLLLLLLRLFSTF